MPINHFKFSSLKVPSNFQEHEITTNIISNAADGEVKSMQMLQIELQPHFSLVI